MSADATTTVTLRVPVALKERFDWMAQVLNRPGDAVYLEALQRYRDQEEWQLKDILEALDEATWQEGLPHGDVMRDARALMKRARASRKEAP